MGRGKALVKPKKVMKINKTIQVLSSAKNVARLARQLRTTHAQARRLLTDTEYFHKWVAEAEKDRVLLSYAFISRALSRMKKEITKSSYMATAKSFGIASDKLLGQQRTGVAQQINIEGGAKVRFTEWSKAPYKRAKPRSKPAKKKKNKRKQNSDMPVPLL